MELSPHFMVHKQTWTDEFFGYFDIFIPNFTSKYNKTFKPQNCRMGTFYFKLLIPVVLFLHHPLLFRYFSEVLFRDCGFPLWEYFVDADDFYHNHVLRERRTYVRIQHIFE